MAPIPPTLNRFSIQVIFNISLIDSPEGPISIVGIGPGASNPLLVPPGISAITFSLIVVGDPGENVVAFPASPIEWFSNEEPQMPVIQPEWFVIHWLDPKYFTIMDFNTAPVRMPHPFNVLVSYNNKTYGTDPVIINEPPGQ